MVRRPTNHNDPSPTALLQSVPLLFLLLLLTLAGCADMPILEEETRVGPPVITLGPYLTDPEPGSIQLRFRTNRRTTAGLRFAGSGRLYRFASGDFNHAIRLTNIAPGETRDCRLWLDDRSAGQFTLSAPVQHGEAVTLAFAGGQNPNPGALERAGAVLAGANPTGLVVTDELMAPNVTSIEAWRTGVFEPWGRLLTRVPLYFPPGSRAGVPTELFPLKEVESLVWRRQVGCVYLVGIETNVLQSRGESASILEWLARALASRPSDASWTVLLLSEPVFIPTEVNARSLRSLSEIIEQNGVDLVLSGGSGTYHRTVPLVGRDRREVRYITTAGLGGGRGDEGGREYTAFHSSEPHVGLLRATPEGLTWEAVNLSGRVLDRVALGSAAGTASEEPVLETRAIMTDALAVVTLRREVLSIGRQAARAVPDPDAPGTLVFRVRNPSNRTFSGTLTWDMPADSAYRLTPAMQRFDLAPGKAGLLSFEARKVGGQAWPTLLVDTPGVGYLRRTLLLTQQKRADVPLLSGEVRVDGRFNEDVWKRAAELEGFSLLFTGNEPTHVVRCSVLAVPAGLAVGLRCEAKRPQQIPVLGTNRDAAVHEDESVEVFVDPRRQGSDYRQFSVNTGNHQLDRWNLQGLAWNAQWQSRIRFGRTEDEVEYYNAEILIPYAALGLKSPPRPGESWGVNVTRNDRSVAMTKQGLDASIPAEVVQWAPTQGSNGRSGCYGVLQFVQP